MQQQLTPKSWDGMKDGVHGVSDAAYDKLRKKFRSDRAVFEAAYKYQSPRRHGLGRLCHAHGIDPVA